MGRNDFRIACTAALGALVLVPAMAGAAGAPGRAAPADSDSYLEGISADGRLVAFDSYASNLVPGDTNHARDVFVRDRTANTVERVSVTRAGGQARGGEDGSGLPAISADGRFVAFRSYAPNLVPGDTNDSKDVFVRDLTAKTTERVSVSSGGAQAQESEEGSTDPAISADGRFVAFDSEASNLVAGDTNQSTDIFVRDRAAGTTERASVSGSGAQAEETEGGSGWPAISADGRYVAFWSDASNLVPGDTNDSTDIFVRDRVAGTTERVTVNSAGEQANQTEEGGGSPSLSPDGRYVAYWADASNLAPGDTNDTSDVFVRDRIAGTTERVSVSSAGAQGNDESWYPWFSADGRLVVFESRASNLVAADSNGVYDVFVRDRAAGTTERLSLTSGGGQANGAVSDSEYKEGSEYPALSEDGRVLAFVSSASNLVAGDTNASDDVFVRDLTAHTTELVSAGRKWTPQAGRLVLSPWPARPGRTLTATTALRAGGGPVPDARAACVASVGGRRLTASVHRFTGSTARCTWRIPATARGKRIAGTVAAGTPGGTASRRFAGRIARR